MERVSQQIRGRVGEVLLVDPLNLALLDLSEVCILVAVESIAEATKDLMMKLGGWLTKFLLNHLQLRATIELGDRQ